MEIKPRFNVNDVLVTVIDRDPQVYLHVITIVQERGVQGTRTCYKCRPHLPHGLIGAPADRRTILLLSLAKELLTFDEIELQYPRPPTEQVSAKT
jgi:hypothetical protein